MKPEWKGTIRLGVVLFCLYLAIHYWSSLTSLLLLGLGAASPLLLGAVIAYAVNILMSLYERNLFPSSAQGSHSKLRRPVCILLAFASLAALLFLLVRMIIPELAQSFSLLIREFVPRLETWMLTINENLDLSQILASAGLTPADAPLDWQSILSSAVDWFLSGLGGVVSLVSAVSSTLFSMVVSLIFSLYLLGGKERLSRQTDLLLKTYLKPLWYSRLMYFVQTLDHCFRRFIVGQCTEAVVLGLLCIGGMMLFRFPYASMVGTLVGFTALIPIAGAYIGAGVGAFMIFTVSPFKALLFLLFIVVLQQLEGNLIYPKIVGSSIGLPGIWVLAAVTIGGGILGIVGMMLAVPLTATCYRMLRHDVQQRTTAKETPAAQDNSSHS